MKTYSIPIIILLIFMSCSDDDGATENNQTPVDNINLVTGIHIRQDSYSVGIRLGNPNTYIDQTLVYPNPPVDFITIQTLNGANISSIWVINGQREKIYQDLNFDSVLNSDTYELQEIENKASSEFLDNESSNFLINLEDLTDGYYRVFVEVNGNIEWHNIYKGAVDITNFINSWD